MPLSQILIDGENWELVADGLKFGDACAADPELLIIGPDLPLDVVRYVVADVDRRFRATGGISPLQQRTNPNGLPPEPEEEEKGFWSRVLRL